MKESPSSKVKNQEPAEDSHHAAAVERMSYDDEISGCRKCAANTSIACVPAGHTGCLDDLLIEACTLGHRRPARDRASPLLAKQLHHAGRVDPVLSIKERQFRNAYFDRPLSPFMRQRDGRRSTGE